MHPDKSATQLSTPAGASVVVALLGEVSTRRDGELVPLPGARARSLLVALAGHPGRSRSAQALIDEIWGDDPPRSPMNALHTQVSRLRAALPDGAVEMGPSGYRLALDKNQVDLTLARLLEQRAQQSHAEGDDKAAVAAVEEARALWRGEPGADLPDGVLARELGGEAAARQSALDTVEVAARTAIGDFAGALPRARAMAGRARLDEAAHLQLMQVLVGLGRSNDALDVFGGLRARLADQLGTDPGQALVELNTAILRGDAIEPPRDTGSRLPNAIGLRAAPNTLLGREADIAAIEDQLRAARVTTVLGPGGTGKTRIVHEVGARAAHSMPVALVELASLRSGEDVVAAISGTLGVSEVDLTPGLGRTRLHSARERLREALSARATLLILDNCEHVIGDVAEVVADLVSASDRLVVLATSRAPMSITAESVYPLPPLVIDEAGSPATDLFRARAKAVRPSARLDPVEVARLCRTLDGLPLAIELAAARVRTMSVEEINTRLADRFVLLRSGDPTSPQRHRTLHAVIDWSWNLLDEQQQIVLQRLCRFPAGFSLSAAEQVAEWGEVTDVASALDGLVNQSMVAVTENDEPVGLRYHMLETVREFGEEQLDSAEANEVTARMCCWARGFAAAAAADFRNEHQVATVHAVEAEHDNMLAVLRYAVARRDAATAYTTFPLVGLLWVIRGAHSEVFNWAPKILDIDARDVQDRVPGDLLVMAYLLAGMHMVLGGDVRLIAIARARLRPLLRDRDDISSAMRLQASLILGPLNGAGVARKLAVAIRSDDPWTRGSALSNRANLRENSGDIDGSIRDALRALDVIRKMDDLYGLAMICQHLGSVYAQTARYAESVVYYRESADALATLHAYEESTQSLAYMSAALIGCGRIDEGRRQLAALYGLESVPVRREDNDASMWPEESSQRLAALSSGLAEADLAEGDIEGGLSRYRTALTVAGWPESGIAPGPYETMVASAVICAHVLYGQPELVVETVPQIREIAVSRLSQFRDVPQMGCVGTAVGSYLIATGTALELGARLLALAVRCRARQDYPAMRLDRHLDAARSVLGDSVVDRELERTASITREAAHAELLASI
ncbi:BTAD domain-containing putative transcriptional regulator [Antrihabitans cavernicola]|uniref:BTAD domain-containing putative transcriptional regulator n=1 Tax=Antrihabitans cavernicola TaxID=2495913 RepID=UPI001F2CDCFC|nr:BTAD domain-containing putative transcriptional regulator [Spelaeibacter cavernicola]